MKYMVKELIYQYPEIFKEIIFILKLNNGNVYSALSNDYSEEECAKIISTLKLEFRETWKEMQ